jgi:hypothetical protein
MKKYSESIRTIIFLALAAWLAFYVPTAYKQPLTEIATVLHLDFDKLVQDPKLVLAFLTPLIYLAERLVYGLISKIPHIYRIPVVGRYLFDNKGMFVGTYLSLPKGVEELNVFRIHFDSLSAKYKLNGKVYSLKDGTQIGDWESDKLEMKTDDPVALSYLYEGERFGKPRVRGHVYIKFEDEKPEKSHNGYWVDVDNVGSDWQRSNYVMATARIKGRIFPNRIFYDKKKFPFLFFRRFVYKPATIFKAYHAKKDEFAKDDPDFKRPA